MEMSLSDVAYYRARIEAEQALAQAADCEKSAAVHTELARHYQQMIDQAAPRETLKIVSPD